MRINRDSIGRLTMCMAVTMVLLVAFGAVVVWAQATWYVDDDCTAPGTGTQADPYCSIQDAIDDATAGDTINVAAGTYTEAIVVDKPLTLQGENRATTIIDGVGTTGAPLVNVPNLTGAVTISGFTIREAQPYGGYDQRVCIAACGGGSGSQLTVVDNILLGGYITTTSERDFGLIMQNTQTDLVFSNNIVDDFWWHGILLENFLGQSEISFNDVTVYDDAYSSFLAHMAYENPSGSLNHVTELQSVHDNTIDANGGSGLVIISAFGSWYNQRSGGLFSNVEIENNVITEIGGKGIQLETDGDGGGFIGTVISGNKLVGQAAASGTTRGIRTLATVTDTLTDHPKRY